jgi:hypothetical protein
MREKKPGISGFLYNGIDSMKSGADLFDFRLFVHNMLADDRVKLLDLQLSSHGALVFGGRVEMPGAC